VHDAPQARVVLAGHPGDGGRGQVTGYQHQGRLEEQRELAALASPGDARGRLDRMRLAVHAGNVRHDAGALLEEVQVPPALLVRVVRGAERLALRTGEPAPPCEADSKLEVSDALGLRVEGNLRDLSGRSEAERRFEELEAVHPPSLFTSRSASPAREHLGRAEPRLSQNPTVCREEPACAHDGSQGIYAFVVALNAPAGIRPVPTWSALMALPNAIGWRSEDAIRSAFPQSSETLRVVLDGDVVHL
jgi:hypothetical protein